MPIYFCNDESIDMLALTTMGVSVKESDNAIGIFGTGGKYSIAILLRNGCKITVINDDGVHEFGSKKVNIRGDDFDIVTLNGEQLSFTTRLGINWVVEDAYRELHSNCLDEGGEIMDSPPVKKFGTVIMVEGELFEKAYRNRHNIFLSTTPYHQDEVCDIHKGGNYVGFYRGIAAFQPEHPSLYTYNVRSFQELSEDRTIKSVYDYKLSVSRSVAKLKNKSMLKNILTSTNAFESTLSFTLVRDFSDEFFQVCEENRSNVYLNSTALAKYVDTLDRKVDHKAIELDEFDSEEIDEALKLLAYLGCNLDQGDFIIVESLGKGVFGAVQEDQILIAKVTLTRGVRFIASTLYEEWIHKTQGLRDESRELQDLLLDRLMYFVAKNRSINEEASNKG